MPAIAVDAGTTVIKAVGYDAHGAEVVVVRRPATVTHPAAGWAEQDMGLVWDTVTATVSEVAGQLEGAIDFVAVTAQGDGAWLIDRDGTPSGPAILWNDGRATDVVARWTESGVTDEAFGINGNLTTPGLPSSILGWMHEHDSERLRASSTLLTCGGWIFYKLTGELAVDESDASAPFMDLHTRTYSAELLRLLDLEWVATLLPPIRAAEQCLGHLTSRVAELTGLPPDTPVVLSSYDIASTAIGIGAVRVGDACSILGTTLCTETVTDEISAREHARGVAIALGVPERFLRAFPTFAGGEVVSWACRLLGLDGPLELGELADRAPFGASGLSFLPYLSPAGERVPFHDPLARGSFLGLSLHHDREHLARSVLEGLSLVIRECLTAGDMSPAELRVCGGGAANATWLQMIADITGVTVTRSIDSEVGARGAFLLGMSATGRSATAEDAADAYVRLGASIMPDERHRDRSAAMFTNHLALRETASRTWPRLAEARRTLEVET